MVDQPVLYSEALENVDEDEDRLIEEIVTQMAEGSRAAYERHRHAIRDAHAKSHAVLKGELSVHSDLPPALAQGIFRRPATYGVVARLGLLAAAIEIEELVARFGAEGDTA